jgi:cell division protein FtsL
LGLLLLSFIHLQNTAIALSYQVERSAALVEELKRENKAYELQVLKLKSPDRVEYLAREKLGMIEPEAVLLKDKNLVK